MNIRRKSKAFYCNAVFGPHIVQPMNINTIMLQLNAIKSGERLLILPLGEIDGRDGRRWNLTEQDAASVVNRIARDGVDIVIDFDHATYWGGQGGAAGWLSAFQVEAGGVTAQVDWTEKGAQAIEAREYRYLSPVFDASDDRVLRLWSVGLVNTPNIAALPAVNAANGMRDMASQPINIGDKPMHKNAADASDDLAKAKGRIDELEAKLKEALQEIVDLKGKLAKRDDEAEATETNAIVDKAIADGRLAPAQREAAVALGRLDKTQLNAMIVNSPLNLKMLEQAQQAKSGGGAAGLSGQELQLCKALGVQPDDYRKQRDAQGGA